MFVIGIRSAIDATLARNPEWTAPARLSRDADLVVAILAEGRDAAVLLVRRRSDARPRATRADCIPALDREICRATAVGESEGHLDVPAHHARLAGGDRELPR